MGTGGGCLCRGAAYSDGAVEEVSGGVEVKNPEKLAGIFQVSKPAMVIAIANFLGSARNFQ